MAFAASETRDPAAADFDLTPPGHIRRLVGAVWRAMEKSRRRRLLQGMPDHLLKDIGISRCDIDGIVDALVEDRDDPTRHPRRRRRTDHPTHHRRRPADADGAPRKPFVSVAAFAGLVAIAALVPADVAAASGPIVPPRTDHGQKPQQSPKPPRDHRPRDDNPKHHGRGAVADVVGIRMTRSPST